MRSMYGQLSDNKPIRRTLDEKKKQLRELKETLATMKPHTAPSLRESIVKRIHQLEVELRSATTQPTSTPKPRAQTSRTSSRIRSFSSK